MSFVPAMPAGSLFGSDQDEVVVHHRLALEPEALGDEFLLLRPGMDEDDVGIAAPAGVERLAGALRDDADLDAGLRLEQRQDMAEQAGILRRGRRGYGDEAAVGCSRRGGCRRRASSSGRGRCPPAWRRTRRRAAGVWSWSWSSPRFCRSLNGSSPDQLPGQEGARLRRVAVRRRRRRPDRPRSDGRDAGRARASARRLAWPRSCVDISTVMPSATRPASKSSICRVAAGSSCEVGSSRKSSSGRSAQARAMARRCCSPPESRRAGCAARSARPKRAQRGAAALAALAAPKRRQLPAHG